MPIDDPNVGLAFGLATAAGAASAVGGALVFVPRLVRLASRRTLAGALALSAGVMTYVSFVEIFGESIAKFAEAGYSDSLAYAYGTLCFFGGVAIMLLLNAAVSALLGSHHHHHLDPHPDTDATQGTEPTEAEVEPDSEKNQMVPDLNAVACPCYADDPVGDLERVQRMAEEMELFTAPKDADPVAQQPDSQGVDPEEGGDAKRDAYGKEAPNNNTDEENNLMTSQEDDAALRKKKIESQKLMRMSLNTALAIAIHNFPEGLATFVSTLADPNVGIVLAVAIAIHNIPEGICVAMPVYYATGSRWKAFGWAVLVGLFEPFAALLGWAVLASVFSDELYGILFGGVAGIMVIISIREIMPTAQRYDPDDSVVTYAFITGMAIMALSLVLFML